MVKRIERLALKYGLYFLIVGLTILMRVNVGYAQTGHLATYFNLDHSGQKLQEQISLRQSNGSFQFCFITGYREVLIDSLVDGKEIKILQRVPDQSCSYSYGDYSFKKVKNHIYLSYIDSKSGRRITHEQYPIKGKDTTFYIYLFSGPHYGEYPSTDGQAYYERDTIVGSYDGNMYECYLIREVQSGAMDLPVGSNRRIYIDKVTLLPVRYDYLDRKGGLKEYFLIDRIPLIMRKKANS